MRTAHLAPFALAALLISMSPPSVAFAESACRAPGVWLDADDGATLNRSDLLSNLAGRDFVLLGETHTEAEHHRWQLHTLAALHGRVDSMIIGFEMFPRRVQPALDRWVDGELTDDEFLRAVDWSGNWNFDAQLYMPLFHFARMHAIPMVALNVDRSLISRVGQEGWDAIAPDDREGIGDPATASPSYETALADVYRLHANRHGSVEDQPPAEASETDPVLQQPGFRRFVEAQLTWDRAMAEGLAGAFERTGAPLIVGIMGTGHLSYFHGVPHQLDDLGFSDAAVLVPVEAGQACDRLGGGFADALFTVAPREEIRPPQLGVALSDAQGAALIDDVLPDSVAGSADLRQGDRVVHAAGQAVPDAATLASIIDRQAPGTWLPLTVERDGSTIDLIARFPAEP